MVQLFLFLLSIIFSKGNCTTDFIVYCMLRLLLDTFILIMETLTKLYFLGISDLTLEIEPHSTVLHGDRVTFTCSKNGAQLASAKWNLGMY